MTKRPQNRLCSFFAMFCLVAVVFLYAPLGGASWSLYSSACCTSKECPIKGHHAKHSPDAAQHAMDCGHDMPAMASCSMSCCHNPDRPAVAPVIFVLPAPLTLSAIPSIQPFVALPDSQGQSTTFEPLSPPPRLSPLAA